MGHECSDLCTDRGAALARSLQRLILAEFRDEKTVCVETLFTAFGCVCATWLRDTPPPQREQVMDRLREYVFEAMAEMDAGTANMVNVNAEVN